MANPCTYRFGEFDGDEQFPKEFFVGYLDCSQPTTGNLDCNRVLIYPKPHIYTQRDLDYNSLFSYVNPDLLSSINLFRNKSMIGKFDECLLYFNNQTKWLIEYLLLFKEELSIDPTVDNYLVLFAKYKIDCINKQFVKNYSKLKYIKDMLAILSIADLISLNNYVYYQSNSGDSNLDPIYYLANI